MKTYKRLSQENKASFCVKHIINFNLEGVKLIVFKLIKDINDVPTLESISSLLEDTFEKLNDISSNYFITQANETNNKENSN